MLSVNPTISLTRIYLGWSVYRKFGRIFLMNAGEKLYSINCIFLWECLPYLEYSWFHNIIIIIMIVIITIIIIIIIVVFKTSTLSCIFSLISCEVPPTFYSLSFAEGSLYITFHAYWSSKAWGQDGWILAKFSFCVFIDREEGQYPAILTGQAWSVKDYMG